MSTAHHFLRSLVGMAAAVLSLGAVACGSQLSASAPPSGAHGQSATREGEPLHGATLHVTPLDSSCTSCDSLEEAGLPVQVGVDLRPGVYAVSTPEAPTTHAMPYDIVFRKL